MARGLCHLHGLQPQIIHGDIKAKNSLLDCILQEKIIDFVLQPHFGQVWG